tara:strand:- start:93 stop:287 length:195 start_codon:yes stop_codon:yes gene_type:complete
MVLAFALVVIVSNEVVSDERMLFRDVLRCNYFARQLETTSEYERIKVTAYCIPRLVNETVIFYD